MNVQYCSICSTSFDFDLEGDKGMIGLIPFAFCATCRAGVVEYVEGREDSAHKHDWTDVDALGWKTCLGCGAGLPPSMPKDPNRIPFETFTKPTCRGDPAFGNNCGHCERCEWLRNHGRPTSG